MALIDGGKRIKYLNNRVEQDHRGIKNITKYTLGFKSFEAAEATIAGIELHRILKKEQMQNSADAPSWKQFYELAALLRPKKAALNLIKNFRQNQK